MNNGLGSGAEPSSDEDLTAPPKRSVPMTKQGDEEERKPTKRSKSGEHVSSTTDATNTPSETLGGQQGQTGPEPEEEDAKPAAAAPSGPPSSSTAAERKDPEEMTDAEKLEAKREYNRRNAARARARNKEMVARLQEKVAILTQKSDELEQENKELKEEVKSLKAQLQASRGGASGGDISSGMTASAVAAGPADASNAFLSSLAQQQQPQGMVPASHQQVVAPAPAAPNLNALNQLLNLPGYLPQLQQQQPAPQPQPPTAQQLTDSLAALLGGQRNPVASGAPNSVEELLQSSMHGGASASATGIQQDPNTAALLASLTGQQAAPPAQPPPPQQPQLNQVQLQQLLQQPQSSTLLGGNAGSGTNSISNMLSTLLGGNTADTAAAAAQQPSPAPATGIGPSVAGTGEAAAATASGQHASLDQLLGRSVGTTGQQQPQMSNMKTESEDEE